jgi:hypothetical protein
MTVRRGILQASERDWRAASAQRNCKSSRSLQTVVVGRRFTPPIWRHPCRAVANGSPVA